MSGHAYGEDWILVCPPSDLGPGGSGAGFQTCITEVADDLTIVHDCACEVEYVNEPVAYYGMLAAFLPILIYRKLKK